MSKAASNMQRAAQLWWQQRDTREKTLLTLAAALVGVALVWGIAISPALRTLQKSASQQAALQDQLQTMARMQAQAKALQTQAPLSQTEAAAALSASVQQAFGSAADITVRAGDASVTLRGVSADALAQWLATARTNAHAVPLQARLTRTGATWSGTLQLGLPTP
ncbi:MAG: type II secretion system protein M [Rhodoferax sp.]|nr:type II secretion system protein M [Rhodoferax sp.]